MDRTCSIPALVLGVLSLLGCGGGESGSSQLRPLGSCAEVEQAIRDLALDEMNRRIDQNLEFALQSERGWCGSSVARSDTHYFPPTSGGGMVSSLGGANQVSTTNNQVAGVDEADFVKNDSRYVYVASGRSFRIIQAWPAASTKEIARVSLEGTPRSLFVAGNRALVYSSLAATGDRSACTYGYSCRFTGDGHPTLITIFDITIRSAPRRVRELRLSSAYVSSRRVGNAVFTVLTSAGASFPDLTYRPLELPQCGSLFYAGAITRAFERLRAENARIIEETPLDDLLPTMEDRILAGPRAGTRTDLLRTCPSFFRSGVSDGRELTTLLGLDIAGEKPATSATILSRPGAVYASAQALYVAVPHHVASAQGWFSSMSGVSEASNVHKFDLASSSATASYVGSGVVKGHVLNQFAMDEKDRRLRIATSTGWAASGDAHSTVTVLAQQGSGLVEVGRLDHLAPNEDIRSVRFTGDRCYMVTFEQTDPLFVIDLARPTAPRVLSELKIPGFSTYLHLMDAKHLLAVGYDTEGTSITGVMLQIFDVSDPRSPVRTHKEVIGTRSSSSAALTNHLAFTFFAPRSLLALPVTVCDRVPGSYSDELTFSGLLVYDVTAQAGFKRRGEVPHPPGPGVTCSNWWTQGKSQVQRSLIMDDYVFSISRELIKVNHLQSLSTDLVSLRIAD